MSTMLSAVPGLDTKVTAELVTVTPDTAEKWLGRNRGNRNLRAQKVRSFARDMRNGRWQLTGQPVQFDSAGTMIDGQHRCEAIIESGVTLQMWVVRGLNPSAREVIDTGTKRTPADALKFAGFAADPNVTAAMARIALGRENGYMRTAFAGTSPHITNAEAIAWVEQHSDCAAAVALARATGKQIGIAPSVWSYCLYELAHIDADLATEFASSMAEYRGLAGKGDPRVAMVTAFRNAQIGTRRVPSTAESMYIVFRAWNAWVTGKTLNVIVPRGGAGSGNSIPTPVRPTSSVRQAVAS